MIADLTPYLPRILNKNRLNLLWEIALAQFKLRDQSTILGFAWSFLNPLIMLLVLYAIFSGSASQNIEHYAIYLLIGLVHYTHFSKSTSNAMQVLYSMKTVTMNAIFPKEILVFGSVLSNIPDFVISLILTVAIALLVGVGFSPALLALPVVFILQGMLVLWISLLLSSLFIFVRDIDHIYQVFLRILFFATPIFYTLDFLGPLSSQIVLLNPLAHLLSFSRLIIIDGQLPSVSFLLMFFLVNAGLIYVVLQLFKKTEPRFGEYL